MISPQHSEALTGSRDGNGAGDHDVPYVFGRRPCTDSPYPFSTREYARLLALRSRVHASDRFHTDLN
jgi:hypothetical protein